MCTALCGIRDCGGFLLLCQFSSCSPYLLQYVLKKPEAVMFKK